MLTSPLGNHASLPDLQRYRHVLLLDPGHHAPLQ